MTDKILNKILTFAQEDENIRAAVLNGSRVNPNVIKDEYQDYDVWMIVKDSQRYRDNQAWIKTFGTPLIMQINPSIGEAVFYGEKTEGLIFLMLFENEHRIDMSFTNLQDFNGKINDSLSKVLLDKDGILPKIPQPSDVSYRIKKPTASMFHFVVNEFFWCLTNVAKGMRRKERIYVNAMFERIVRPVFMKMMTWYVGLRHDWRINVGSFDKWLENYLSKEEQQLFAETFPNHNDVSLWNSIFVACKLFEKASLEVSRNLAYKYPIEQTTKVVAYLQSMREGT